jgi:hypothetical protein
MKSFLSRPLFHKKATAAHPKKARLAAARFPAGQFRVFGLK